MRLYKQFLTIVLFLLFLPQAHAGFCNQNISIGTPISDSWDTQCESIHYLRYDPYSPQSGYPAKFFQFELDRDADVRISMAPEHYAELFLIEGNDKYAAPLLSFQDDKIETRLTAGTYIVEAVSRYTANATVSVEYNDIGQSQCVSEISMGTSINDGWISACESTSRDITDPYNTIPEEGHRAKYFTFSLNEDADVSINVDATVDSHIYILEGHGEFGTPYAETAQESSSHFLTAGDYTIELTTNERYAPGQFSIRVNSFVNSNGCDQTLPFDTTLSGTWSSDCAIRSWIDGNGDPYQGGNSPERANYYTFTLEQASDIKFIRTAGNDNSTVMSLYSINDYYNKLKTTQPSYWGSPASQMTASLSSGSYVLEVTQFQQIASGQYEISTELLTTNGCNNLIAVGDNKDGILSPSCTSSNRGTEGNSDPYGTQPGTYYAKRFEFTLTEESSVRIAANSSDSSYLYLAKKTNGTLNPLTQSWSSSYWSTTSDPSIDRQLDAGTYIVELTSHYSERELTFNLSLQTSSNSFCESFIRINERRSGEFLNPGCKSTIKAPIYNHDPYSNNSTQYFYAKSYSFEISQAGSYEITTASNTLDTHIFLFDGGDSHYLNLDDKSSYSTNNTLTYYLTPGIYSTEITTAYPDRTGAFSLVVWDKTSEITEYQVADGTCSQVLTPGSSQVISTSTNQYCSSDSWGDAYPSKYFTFNTAKSYQLNTSVNAGFSVRLGLYRYDNGYWNLLHNNYNYSGTAKIDAEITAGQYKLEVSSLYQNITGEFTLNTSILIDSDGDGYADINDEFPNDPSEWLDTDKDGLGNNLDMDDDNDLVADIEDAFPLDSNESKDSDFDNIGDNSDPYPYSYLGDIRFSEESYSVAEDANSIEVTVSRIAPSYGMVLYYFTHDLDALAIKDYTPTLGKLEFLNSETEKTITIPIINNDQINGDRSFELYLLTTRYSYGSSFSQGNSTTISITDDELPTTTIGLKETVIQTNESSRNIELSLIRTGDLSQSNKVYFRTKDGSASALEDYIPLSGALEFEAGETEVTISIQLIADNNTETQEAFIVELLDSEKAALINTQAEVIIQSEASAENTLYSLGLEKVSIVPNGQYFSPTILRNNTDARSSVSFSVKGLTEEYDYASIVTFQAGEKGKKIDLPILNSGNTSWNRRTIEMKLTGATNGHLIDNTPMIINIQAPTKLPYEGTFIASSDTYIVKEGESTDIVLSYLSEEEFIREVDISTLPATASADEDYLTINAQLSITTNKTSASIQLDTLNDELYEGNESLNILIDSQQLPISKVIIDDSLDYQGKGIVRFSANHFSTESSQPLALALQRLYGTKGNLAFTVASRDGSAMAGQHYSAFSKELELDDGSTSSSVTINIIESNNEQPLYFYLDLTTQLGAGKEITETARVDIVPTINSDKKKSDDSFLGLGFMNAWLLLLLAFPFFIGRIRFTSGK